MGHHRCFAGVDPGWEWSPTPLAARAVFEVAFFEALEDAVPAVPVSRLRRRYAESRRGSDSPGNGSFGPLSARKRVAS
jgi:hypothetical protein